MKRRVFISQPTQYLTNKKILEEREIHKQTVLSIYPNDEIEFVESVVDILDSLDTSEVRTMSVACIGKSISLMATADVVYFADNWRNSNWCMIEYNICNRYGIPIECSNR